MEAVSFVVTVYNKRPWLPAVLRAIEAQRGDFVRELVVVDDGSGDGSGELLEALLRDQPRSRLIRQSNQGSAAATNAGVAAARHPLIKLVDGDDLLLPDATRLLAMALERTGSILAGGRSSPYTLATPPQMPAQDELVEVEAFREPVARFLRDVSFNPSQMLFTREAFEAVGGCDEGVICQDLNLSLKLALKGPVCRIGNLVTHVATDDPGRVGASQERELHNVNLALAQFLRAHPQTPVRWQRLAAHKALSRARNWSRRHGQRTAPWWRLLLANGVGVGEPAALIERSLAAFDPGSDRPDSDGA